MLPVIRVVGGSVKSIDGWLQLTAMGANGVDPATGEPYSPAQYPGQNVSAAVMLTSINTTAGGVDYFAFSPSSSEPSATVGADAGQPHGQTGNIPVLAGHTIIVAQPPNTLWWGSGSTNLIITPVEVIHT